MPKIIAQKEDWLQLGFELFSEKGRAGIIIEKMAARLKVNKSSFYWHFKTKDEFIQQLINFWTEKDTEQIISVTSKGATALAKFNSLIELSYKQVPNQDFIFFLKRYGRKEKKIKSLIEKIDNQRMGYVKKLLEDMGYSEEEATLKSSLFYKHLIGYHEMIRYQKQSADYQMEVKKELNQFIDY